MKLFLLCIGIFLVIFSSKDYIKCQWVYLTGVQVYNEQDLYNAVDNPQTPPWWKSKNIVIRANKLVLDRNITVPAFIYFAPNFKSYTSIDQSDLLNIFSGILPTKIGLKHNP